jgi:hypothetical protein
MKPNKSTTVLLNLVLIMVMAVLLNIVISTPNQLFAASSQAAPAGGRMKGTNNSPLVEIALLLLPLIFGALIAALNKDGINNFTEKIESHIRKLQTKIAPKQGRISRFVIKPLLWIIVKLCDWTDSFAHRGLKNGVRVTVTLYILTIWLFLLYTAFIVVAVIIIAMVVIYILLKFIPGGDSESTYVPTPRSFRKQEPVKDDIIANVGQKGMKIYAGTNWFNEEMKGRIDDDGNIYKGTSWLSEAKIGRIDDNGNIYSGNNFFNEQKVGRIEKDGTVQKGSNWFTEEKVGRIDEDGNIFKGTSSLNEEKQGRTEK